MRLINTKNIFASLILVILASCSGTPPNSERTSSSKSEVPVNNQTFLYINDSANFQIAQITIDGNGNTTLIADQKTHFGEVKKEKLKYYDQSNNMAYEIKYKEDGFKLRDQNSNLLWKVKRYENKIKISDNEEMENAIEVKIKGDKKITIIRPGEAEQVIRLNPESTPLNISNKYLTTGFKSYYHAGILMLDNIPPVEKTFIIKELHQ